MQIQYSTLKETSGGRIYALIKQVKESLGVSWRTPLEETHGGPLTVYFDGVLPEEICEDCDLITRFECGSKLYTNNKGGLALTVPC
jgi:hypothetical protein